MEPRRRYLRGPDPAGRAGALVAVSLLAAGMALGEWGCTRKKHGSPGSVLVVETATLPSAGIGRGYSEALTASGGTTPYGWSLAGGALPDGLGVDPAGLVVGVPTLAATNGVFTVKVTDSRAGTPREATRELAILVEVSITTPSLPDGGLTQPYLADVDAAGGDGTYTFLVDPPGGLPPGLSLDGATGAITGTPAAAGSYPFDVVAASNPAGLEGRMGYAIAIDALTVGPPGLPNASIGIPYSQTLTASGGTPPYAFSLDAGSLPDGLGLVGGAITGTPPPTAVNSTFTVRATDSGSPTLAGTQTYTLLVNVEITTLTLPDGQAGYPYAAPLVAIGGDGQTYAWSLASGQLVCGLSVLPSPGEVSGSPCCDGSFVFDLQVASDPPSLGAMKGYTLQVGPWTSVGEGVGEAQFGRWVASAGDVNGDGFDDLVVGAPLFDSSGVRTGKAYLFLGSAGGLSPTHSWSATGDDQRDSNFGVQAATAGDVNGDGYDDVIVGANAYDPDGKAYVYLGGPAGLGTAPAWTALGDYVPGAASNYGYAVGTAGDVDGDGYDDVIVTAPGFETPAVQRMGKGYVYLGGSGGLSPTPAWTSIGDGEEGASFGTSASTAGDVDGDGFEDVIVGATQMAGAVKGPGKAFVFLGSAGGLAASPAWTSVGENQVGAYFGRRVSSARDVDGDGFDDVIVGAGYHDNGSGMAGKAYVYLGGAGGPAPSPAWTAVGDDQPFANFGTDAGAAGDVNGDGYADVIVGANGFDTALTNVGKAYLYLGGPSGLSASPVWTSLGDEGASAAFGFSAGSAGDVNGDGYDEVVVGAGWFDTALTNVGKAYVFCAGR